MYHQGPILLIALVSGLSVGVLKAAGTPEDEEFFLRKAYEKPPDKWPAALVPQGVDFVEIAPLPEPIPTDPKKTELGAMLFFDPRLSRSQQISCASCHDPELGWTDGRSLPFGNHRKVLFRNTPALLNAVRQSSYFWDGRAASLEELIKSVVTNHDEMHGDWKMIGDRLQGEEVYREKFAEVFGTPMPCADSVAEAIAEFVRSIQSRGRSRFDQFVAGDFHKLADVEILGLHLFRTKASCVSCHHGPFFTDNQFHDLGLSYFGRKLQDLGRYHATGDPQHSGQFKTPSLRNISRTAPYMHVGLFPLRGVLHLYNAGMPILNPTPSQENNPLFPKKSPLLKPLNLSNEEIAAIEAFLNSLEEPPLRTRTPPYPKISEQ